MKFGDMCLPLMACRHGLKEYLLANATRSVRPSSDCKSNTGRVQQRRSRERSEHQLVSTDAADMRASALPKEGESQVRT
jgi:hypothetical protein